MNTSDNLEVKQKHLLLKKRKDTLETARNKIECVMKELQAELHTPWPDKTLSSAIAEFDSEIQNIGFQMLRMDAVGR
jgi:hypothetical protein